jgi:hypothetical protein
MVDQFSSWRNDSYPSGHQEAEPALSANAEQARDFVPVQVPRQPSLSSDEWQKVSPPSASAPNGKMFTFGETFDPERDFPVTHVKQEVRFPGKQQSSSTSGSMFAWLTGYASCSL